MLKKSLSCLLVSACVSFVVSLPETSYAQLGAQAIFRGGYANLYKNRGGQTFSGNSTRTDGWFTGAGLDIPLLRDPWRHNALLWEVMLSFSRFAPGNSGPSFADKDEVGIADFTAAVGPKYRFEHLGEAGTFLSKIRPWVYREA